MDSAASRSMKSRCATEWAMRQSSCHRTASMPRWCPERTAPPPFTAGQRQSTISSRREGCGRQPSSKWTSKGRKWRSFRAGAIRLRVILFEADENCRRFGHSPSDLCAFVQDLADYDIRFIDERSEQLRPLHDPCSRDMPQGDYLAL